MQQSLHWQTVTPLLKSGLKLLMAEPLFSPFRLVGGTSLSLQRGHRISIDIDLFTDAEYGTINFSEIDTYLREKFPYVSPESLPEQIAFGISYIVGNSSHDSFKLDFYYTDPFVWNIVDAEGIRMATQEEIAAMKIDVVQRGGRKKDFWDLHELSDSFTINEMIAFHKQRHPYSHDEKTIKKNLIDFSAADEDFDPQCLKGKHWELIKLDFLEMLK